MEGRRGISTIECLVAMVVFAVGALGAVATTGLGFRLAAAGDREAAAARYGHAVADSLFAAAGPHQSCPPPGQATDPTTRVTAAWQLLPAPGGRELTLVLSGPGIRSDSSPGFLPCR